tara:strand:+ start:2805 stop:3023 length:219 start_codon:yes stop_codon:yes gene_type:complete
MPKWNPLTFDGDGWVAGQYNITENTPLIFVRLPAGYTTLGRIDKLPFVYIHEMGCTMLINAATEGVLVLPVE